MLIEIENQSMKTRKQIISRHRNGLGINCLSVYSTRVERQFQMEKKHFKDKRSPKICDRKECPRSEREEKANLGVITIPFPLSLCIIIICFSRSEWIFQMKISLSTAMCCLRRPVIYNISHQTIDGTILYTRRISKSISRNGYFKNHSEISSRIGGGRLLSTLLIYGIFLSLSDDVFEWRLIANLWKSRCR